MGFDPTIRSGQPPQVTTGIPSQKVASTDGHAVGAPPRKDKGERVVFGTSGAFLGPDGDVMGQYNSVLDGRGSRRP